MCYSACTRSSVCCAIAFVPNTPSCTLCYSASNHGGSDCKCDDARIHPCVCRLPLLCHGVVQDATCLYRRQTGRRSRQWRVLEVHDATVDTIYLNALEHISTQLLRAVAKLFVKVLTNTHAADATPHPERMSPMKLVQGCHKVNARLTTTCVAAGQDLSDPWWAACRPPRAPGSGAPRPAARKAAAPGIR